MESDSDEDDAMGLDDDGLALISIIYSRINARAPTKHAHTNARTRAYTHSRAHAGKKVDRMLRGKPTEDLKTSSTDEDDEEQDSDDEVIHTNTNTHAHTHTHTFVIIRLTKMMTR